MEFCKHGNPDERCKLCQEEYAKEYKRKASPSASCYVRREDVSWIVQWVIANSKHLESDDTYLLEKEIDKCHLLINQRA